MHNIKSFLPPKWLSDSENDYQPTSAGQSGKSSSNNVAT